MNEYGKPLILVLAVMCLATSTYAVTIKAPSVSLIAPYRAPAPGVTNMSAFAAYYATILQDVLASAAPEDLVLPVATGTVTVKGPVVVISTIRDNGYLWGANKVPNEIGVLETSTGKFWYRNKATGYYESTTIAPKVNTAVPLPLYVQYKNTPITISAFNSTSSLNRVTLNQYVVLSTPVGKELVTPYYCTKKGAYDRAKYVYFDGSENHRNTYWYLSSCTGDYRQMDYTLVGWPKNS